MPSSTAGRHGRRCKQAARRRLVTTRVHRSIAPLYSKPGRSSNLQRRSSAPLNNATESASPSCWQRCYDAGDIELDLTGQVLHCLREYYTDDELDPGDLCRIHKLPVEASKRRTTSSGSVASGPPLAWYAAHPGAIVPSSEATKPRLIRVGLRDFSVSRTSLSWGIPLPWDPKHVAYVWFDALANYLTAVGYGSDPQRFAEWWPAHHLIGKDIIRHHCAYWPAMLISAGIEPPASWAVGGWLLVGSEKMSKTTATWSTRWTSSPSRCSMAFATTSSPRLRRE